MIDFGFYNMDCMEGMREFPDKYFDLAIVDPPYNIGKADWDKVKDYINWLGYVILEIQRILKENGSMYFFHNNMMQLKDIMVWIEKNTDFVFKQFIVWNKRFEGSRNKGFLDGYVAVENLRNYQQLAEYIVFYTFQDETGLTKVKYDINNFKTLRQYFKTLQEYIGLNKKQIIDIIGQKADHCFRWGSSQWDLPTKKTYQELIDVFKIDKWENFKTYENLRQEYENLRQEYEDQRYTFNNQKTHHSVWNYDFVSCDWHPTPKPPALIENILKHSSNENDIVLDPFAGTGVVGEVCIKLNRRYVGFEIDKEYYEAACKRLKIFRKQLTLFEPSEFFK